MDGLLWLMYASIAVWTGLGGYLFLLGTKAARLETRLSRMEYATRKHAAFDPGDEN